jgi:hypothetical protein
MADDGSSDSSRAREALLTPLFTKELGDPPVMSPVVCAGRLRFASLDSSGQPNLATARGTAAPQRVGSGGGSSSDGAWCELFADPETGESQLAVFDDSRRLDRDTAGADPRELLTFHWKTKALLPRTTAAAGLQFFTITYVFSAVRDERFDGGSGGGGAGARKHVRVDRVAVLVPTAEQRTEWFQKLQASLQMIPQPLWMGPLQKKPTQGSGARRALSKAHKRFFVLEGANIIYYTDNKLLVEKGKLTLTAAATVARVEDASSGVPNFTLAVGARTLVAESLQTNPQLRAADIENWILKIQQTIDALAELDQQLLAEASQPEQAISGGGGADDSFGGGGGGGDDDDVDLPFYDDDGNILPGSERLRRSRAVGGIAEDAADGYNVSRTGSS